MWNWRCTVLTIGLVVAAQPSAKALTPDSPEAQRLIKGGLAFLAKTEPGAEIGAKAVVALAFFKAGQPDHPLVKSAVEAIRKQDFKSVDNYSTGLAIILLAELNNQEDHAALQAIVNEMLSRQKPHGGWGYGGSYSTAENADGDTSQTQYAVLGMWNARAAGCQVPDEAVVKVCNWLIRAQDVSGGWPYTAKDPGNYQRIQQPQQPRHSTCAAGLGSLMICADMLNLNRRDGKPEESDVPEALKVIRADKDKEKKRPVAGVDPKLLERATNDGAQWFNQNYAVSGVAWNFYYLYGLERCEAFRELYTGKFAKEPKWYNDGVAFLGQRFDANQGWSGDHSASVSTSFAVLFLLRSARKAIAAHHKDLGEGVLSSGKGLPTDVANVSVKRGKVIDSKLAGEVDDVVALLNDPDNPELSRLLDSNEDIHLDSDLTKRKSQIVKMRESVSSGNWEARMVAVRGLGKVRDLDSVPPLLYSLSDPDVRVVKEADTALRFISRKFDGVGLPDEPDKAAIQKARNAWRTWYLSIRPNAQLID